jgi:hypothetical protein
MSVAISNLGSAALELDVHGKLHGDDYRKFSTVAEQHRYFAVILCLAWAVPLRLFVMSRPWPKSTTYPQKSF